MRVSFDLPDCEYREEIENIIGDVVEKHPLGSGILTPEVVDKLEVIVSLNGNDPCFGPEIDCSNRPVVVIRCGLAQYMSPDSLFERDLFAVHMYHEFTHLIDWYDQDFGVTEEKRKKCAEKSTGISVDVCIELWNLYINGRLWRRDIKVETFDEYKQKKFGKRLARGLMNLRTLEIFEKAYLSNNLSYDGIITMAEEIVAGGL